MPYLIGFSGPSTSGKTELTRQLSKHIEFTLVKLDNYWKKKPEFPTKFGYKNWDSPKAINFDLLYENLKELKKGNNVKSPIWNKGEFIGWKILNSTRLIIAEGFLLFYKKKVRDLFDLKFYFEVPEDVMLSRRMKRSKAKTSREEYYRKVMLTEHKKYVRKQKDYADQVLDGTDKIKINTQKILKIIEKTCPK